MEPSREHKVYVSRDIPLVDQIKAVNHALSREIGTKEACTLQGIKQTGDQLCLTYGISKKVDL